MRAHASTLFIVFVSVLMNGTGLQFHFLYFACWGSGSVILASGNGQGSFLLFHLLQGLSNIEMVDSLKVIDSLYNLEGLVLSSEKIEY